MAPGFPPVLPALASKEKHNERCEKAVGGSRMNSDSPIGSSGGSVVAAPVPDSTWPRFADVTEPRMVAFFTGNGSGSKLFQGFIDDHPDLYMVPGYLLMYLYPHWHQWEEELADRWTWDGIVDAFCVNHASVLDTRRIPGFDGLDSLGESRSEYIAIDEALFRAYLLYLLAGEPIRSRTFVLAVHYAYAKCRGEDLERKTALFFHIHVHKYVVEYLAPDFPDMRIIAMVRDPRSNFRGRFWSSAVAVDESRLNPTDAAIYLARTYNYVIWEQLNGLDILHTLSSHEIRVVRHEDLYYAPEDVMRATARFLEISDSECFRTVTFGGKLWWGDTVYGEQPINAANPSIVSDNWKERTSPVDWLVFEGVFLEYLNAYEYDVYKYKRDTVAMQGLLLAAIFVPSRVENQILLGMFRTSRIKAFLSACLGEASGRVPLKTYAENAYYRHKWTNRSLMLWRPRFFRETLRQALARKEQPGAGISAGFKLFGAQVLYISFNIIRYLGAAFSWPLLHFQRCCYFLAAWRRRFNGQAVLPDTLK